MIKRLTIRSCDNVEQLAEVLWIDGAVTITTPSNGFHDDLKRMVENGLDEWVGDMADPEHRCTPSLSHSFMDRLAEYLARQTGFVIRTTVTNEE